MSDGTVSNPRTLAARIGATARWVKHDPQEHVALMRESLEAKYRREADPTGDLPPAELAKRVARLKRLHALKAALASKKAREARKAAKQTPTPKASGRSTAEGGAA